jgi:hypothetical protein
MRIKKVARIITILLGILFLLIFGTEAFLNFYLNKRLPGYLRERAQNATGGKYELHVGGASLSLLGRSFTANHLILIPDSSIVHKKSSIYLSADRFSLKGIAIFKVLINKKITVSSLELNQPRIKIYQAKESGDKDTATIYGSALFDIIKYNFKSLFISEITISDADLQLFLKGKEALLSNKNSIEISDFLVDEKTADAQRMFLAREVRMTMQRFDYRLSELYTLSGKNLSASYTDSLLSVDSLHLKPRGTKKNFGNLSGKQASRVLLSTGRLELRSLNVPDFFEKNILNAGKAFLDGIQLSVYLDKNIDFVAEPKPSLQKILRGIQMPVKIDSIQVTNSTVEYEHLARGSTKPGKLTFSQVNVNIDGLDNGDTLPSTNKSLRFLATAYFMNVSMLKLSYDFPLNTDKEVFFCKGSLQAMNLDALNPITEHVAFIKIKKGKLNEFSFAFSANEVSSKGTMKFYFKDLDMEMLNKKNSFNVGRKILFFVARTFIINDRNPGRNGKPGITQIHYNRYPNKYFFYYTWKSLQSGIMEALGTTSEKFLTRSDNK